MGLFSSDILSQLSGGLQPAAPTDYVLPTQFPPISRAKHITLDFETHDPELHEKGPGWRRDAYPVGIAVRADWRDGTIFREYYPTGHRGGPNLDESKVYEWLGDELAFYENEIIGANLEYEVDGLASMKVVAPFAKWRDVQYAEALLDEKALGYRLDLLSVKYLRKHKEIAELERLYGKDWKKRFREIHPGHAKIYGIGDVDQPTEILALQIKQLKKENMLDLFDLECRLIPLLIHMRIIGQRVDLDHATRFGNILIENRDEALKRASAICGVNLTVENFQRPRIIGQALDNLKIKYPITKINKQPSIQDAWLKKNAGEFGEQLVIANTSEKGYGTFVTGYVKDFQINGRLHCEFHPLRKVDDYSGRSNGTVTGRFSSSHPNLQNIPKRDPFIGPLCRAMFIPEEGYLQWSADYSQIEFRLLVHAAVLHAQTDRAKAKRRWGKNGEEIWDQLQYAYKAQQMYINDPKTDFHDAVVTLTGLVRDPAKTINFGIAFNMGEKALATRLGLLDENGEPSDEAKAIMKKYHDNVPFVKAVGRAMAREASRDGIISTLLGRRTHFNLWEPSVWKEDKYNKPLPFEEAKKVYGDNISRADTQKALNCYTQGGGADLIKTSMVRIWESGLLNGEELILSLTVHDELGGSVLPTKIGTEKLKELQNIMENAIPLTLPVLTAVGTGRNWSEAH